MAPPGVAGAGDATVTSGRPGGDSKVCRQLPRVANHADFAELGGRTSPRRFLRDRHSSNVHGLTAAEFDDGVAECASLHLLGEITERRGEHPIVVEVHRNYFGQA